MRKILLYILYGFAMLFMGVAIYAYSKSGDIWTLLFWVAILSPVLINALRPRISKEEEINSETQTTLQSLNQNNNTPSSSPRQFSQSVEGLSKYMAVMFRYLGHLGMGTAVILLILVPFFGEVIIFLVGYCFAGALVSYGLGWALQ